MSELCATCKTIDCPPNCLGLVVNNLEAEVDRLKEENTSLKTQITEACGLLASAVLPKERKRRHGACMHCVADKTECSSCRYYESDMELPNLRRREADND